MTLRQLRYVLAVAELGSFTRAAEQLHVSQPTLSQQVRALEAELGGSLLHRPPCRVELTPAGRALAAEARIAVGAADRAARAARRTLGLEPLEIELCTTPLLAVALLPDAIVRWREVEPGVAVALREQATGAAVERAVLEGGAELGIAPRPARWAGAIEPLGADELVAVLPAGDPLLRTHGPVAPMALAERGWVLLDAAHELASTAARACERGGVRPLAAVHVGDAVAAARLAAAGTGPTILPRSVVPAELLHCCRPLDPPASWDVVALGRTPGWSPQARAFLTLLRQRAWGAARPDLRCAV